ncbi:spermidine/putrescine ABC transporter substrate-binding protein [Ectobacillus antri]|jgi:spermidine/putrescine transport system substrate-binding protein|uniref:Spermidine/putrescine ABC transporter substrate-binding protein n=1 Tax=Ectobacillus antri TaxID=2486280 RepID=A0ABT6H4Q6_9BACI|nr:spermidine/putrescine ABC transporter substrate-binding protein [Ectobacillus antri]MDG4657490.1 spermidine/putrescine ABC transporter substrate-binding protein [Ectobacillus antri]MDG5753803.1 spermidine/putrescine ABC transporter substrate-binding protein [Ectobacillus antri]
MKWWKMAAIVAVAVAALTGCGEKKEELNIYSWADNFDEDVIKDFEKKYNVKVNYDKYASNEEMLAKLQAGGAKYDLIQPSDYMVATMTKLDLLEPLTAKNIPNTKNIDQFFRDLPYDPGNKYSVVYAWGITGIAYNKKYIKEAPTSWADLWNPKYKDRVVMLNDSREVLGMGLKKNGFSNNSKNEAEIKTAYEDIRKALPNVLAFDTDNIKQKLIAEEAWLGTVWSGDATFVQKDNKDVAFVIPKEGSTIWADTLAIPKGAKHKVLAEKFINYLMDPEVSKKNYESIGYANPSEGLPLKEEELKNIEWLVDVGDTTRIYDEYWTKLKTGKE